MEELKAYAWDNEYYGTTEIVWAETRGKAKRMIADEQGEPFTEVKVRRLPWADKYKRLEEIPAQVFFDNGWWLTCEKCGERVMDDMVGSTDGYTVTCKCCTESE